jgi:RHS repeat-associated protein
LGSVLALSDEAGAVGTEYTYQPFGATAPGPESVPIHRPEVDDTGLHFIGPGTITRRIQRFIAENPIGFAGARANLYTYAQNNPLRLTDPLGVDVDPARQQSIAATAMAAWDPVRGRAVPQVASASPGSWMPTQRSSSGVIGAGHRPSGSRPSTALRPSAVWSAGTARPRARACSASWTVEQVTAHLLKLPAGAPHRCARH